MSADLEKLLPCPFCGGGAVVSADMNSYPTIACDACGACSGSGDRPGVTAAIAAWNTRALTADNAALRAKAEKLAEALRPFCKLGNVRNPSAMRPQDNIWGFNGNLLTVGDFDAARAALTEWENP